MQIQVIEDKPTESEITALSLRETVAALSVVDQASYDLANVYNANARAASKAFHDFDDPVHDPITEAWKKSCARRKKIDDACDFIIKTTGRLCGAWIRAEEEKVAAEKRRIEAIARKEAEDAQLRAAEALQAEGLTNAAEAALEAPVIIPKIVVEGPVKTEGVSYTDRYSAEGVDILALVKAIAEGKAPIQAVCFDEKWLNQWARLTKGSESIPGVKIVKTTTQGMR
jgi:hypothetical protein